MCSPTSDGAAACIIATEDFVHKHGLENQAIEIVSQTLVTDREATFNSRSAMELIGYGMSKTATDIVFENAGFKNGTGRDEVGVVELHDCFAANEVWGVYCIAPILFIMLLTSFSCTKPWVFAKWARHTKWSRAVITRYVVRIY